MLAGDKAVIAGHERLAAEEREAELRALETATKRFKAIFEPDAEAEAWQMSAPAVQAALFITVYRDRPALHMPYRLLATLMDIDETLTMWRYRHALMVERMIGVKAGTGGSSGHAYLRRTAETHRVFRDLFQLSTYLIPRHALPDIPPEIERRMQFVYAEEGAA
jgi:tryptophan 2,3-dioxygenase